VQNEVIITKPSDKELGLAIVKGISGVAVVNFDESEKPEYFEGAMIKWKELDEVIVVLSKMREW